MALPSRRLQYGSSRGGIQRTVPAYCANEASCNLSSAGPKEHFFLQGDTTSSAAKAPVACSNGGAAARVLGLGIAREGGHEPTWIPYPIPPPVGARKKAWKETLARRIFCTRCCNVAREAEELAKRDYVFNYAQSTVHKMLRRIKDGSRSRRLRTMSRRPRRTRSGFSRRLSRAGPSSTASIRSRRVAWLGEL